MTSHDNIDTSNPSAPIGSNQFSLIVDEDNAIPSSPLLDRPKDIQHNNEIIEGEGKNKSIVRSHQQREGRSLKRQPDKNMLNVPKN